MVSTLRIIYPPSSDNATLLPVLILSVGARRYMFNAPEGTTRAMNQRGTKGLSRADVNLFLPTVGVESGGTAGLIMTLADSGCRTLTVHGPHQLAQHLCSLRSYTQRDQLLLNCNEAEVAGSAGGSQGGARRKEGASAFYKDEHLTVHAVPLVHAGFEDFQAQKQEHKRRKVSERSGSFPRAESRSPLPSDADGEPDWLQLFRPVYPEPRTDGARVWRQLFVPKDQRPIFAEGPAHALSYIVEHPPQRGKFDVQLASALGVPLGPGRATLIKQGSIRFQRPVAWAQMSEQERQDWLQKTQEGKSKKQLKIRDEILQAIENEEVEVQASQVLGETKEGTAFMQLYVPSVDFLPSLLSEDNQRRFERYVAGAKDGVKIAAIIHAAPPDVLTDPHYRSFVERFGGEVQHLISSPAFTRDTNAFSSAALSHLRLSHLDPKIWTPIRYSVSPLRDTAELGLPDAQAVQPDLVVPLVPPGRAHAPPSSAPDLLAPLDDALTQAAVAFRARPPAAKKVGRASQAARESAWAEFVRMCQSLRVQVEEEARERAKADDADHGLVLTPLGTGSASPSKYRNVSGTLVHAPGFNGYMLLDAGEGTYGQLCRRFGHGHKARYEGGPRDAAADALEPGRGVDEVLRELRIMFLSHIHGDHHIGAARILAARHKLRPSRPLYLIANRATLDYLREYSHCEPLGITETVLTIDSAYLEFETGSIFQDPAAEAQTANAGEEGSSRAASPPLTGTSLGFFRQRHRDAMASMGLRELTTCKVIHRVPRCFGLVARSARGWSVAYSGDTQPCAALVRAGKDVDVLVHEATLEDSQHEMAKFKGHSTFGQAIDIARQMNAKHCLLTHFSQRYPKLPRLSAPGAASESGKREPIVALAFDLASIAVRDMWKMERYRPALELLFDADEEEGAEGDAPSAADVPGAAADVQMADAPAAAAPISAEDAAEKASAWQPLGPAVDALQNAAAAKTKAAAPPAYDRFNVKGSESAYIALRLSSPRSYTGPTSAPSAETVHEACQRAVERVHGLVGGAFVIDVLNVRAGSGKVPSHEAILRVASEYLTPLLSALSIELKIALPEAPQVHWRSSVRAISAASGLGHIALSDSRAWLRNNAP